MFLYVRNKLFCTKLLYFMPDTRGCRAHARMPRARAAVCGTSVSFAVTIFKDILNHVYRSSILLDVRKPFCTKLLYTSCLMRADAASRRRCRAHARMPRALVSVEQAFLLQLQSSKSSLMMPKGPKDVQIFLDVRKPFCTKLLYTSCLMRADAAHGRGCRAHARMPRAGADAARAAVCGTSVSFQRYLTVMMPIGVQVFLCVRSYSAQSFYTSCLTRAVAARAAFCGTGVSFAVTILKDNLNRGSTVS